MLVCVFLLPFARETAGAARIRHFLLPLLSRDDDTQTSGASRRENVDVYLLFEIRIEIPFRHCEFVRCRPRGRRRWTKQTPRSSPGLTGRPVFQRRSCSNEKPRRTGSPGQAGRRQSCCGRRRASPGFRSLVVRATTPSQSHPTRRSAPRDRAAGSAAILFRRCGRDARPEFHSSPAAF
jgi:hypothetical protein